MADKQNVSADEVAVRDLIEAWADAVRRKDYAGILRSHSPDFVMFDVPPPFKSVGLDAYRKTWDLFFSWSSGPVRFDIQEMDVTVGADVAFAFATMRCETPGPSEESTEDQRNAHCNLNRKIQIRKKAGMSTEKTFHRTRFLTCTEP